MKADPSPFSQSYRAALSSHLAECTTSSAKTSLSLGRQALKLGLETLELAKIHEEALTFLESRKASDGLDGNISPLRATGFFAEVITPIEETHRGAREANAQMKVALDNLSRRTEELTASNESLKREIEQRNVAEASLRASEAVSNGLLEKSQRMQEELRLLSHRLLSIQENERQRISRELHDVIAQALTGLNVQLATMKKKSVSDASDFNERIEATQLLVERAVDIVHGFARDLRPTVLDDIGLIAALESHMKAFMEETGIRVAFTAFAGLEQVDIAVRTVLFRVAQEALTNVAQHAKASQASVSIQQCSEVVRMEVHDDGVGFAVDGEAFAKGDRLGLLGMRERVEMIGGKFSIESAKVDGTTVRLEIPRGMVNAGKQSSKSSTP